MKKLFLYTLFLLTLVSVSLYSNTGEKLANYLKDYHINPYLIIFIIAMLPIVELRGAIPVGILAFGLNKTWSDVIWVVVASIAGNMAPIFFILLFLNPVEKILRKIKFFDNIFDWLFKRTIAKSSAIEKYEELGLMLFVAIPAPVTGAWTGSLAAYLFKLKYVKSIIFIFLGVLIAAAIVTFTTLTWTIDKYRFIAIGIISIMVLSLLYVAIKGFIDNRKAKKDKLALEEE